MHDPFVITIPTRDAHPVVADWYRPTLLQGGDLNEVIILCHGFTGHRRWGFIPTLARRLRAAGFGALAIDFSHNGHIPADASSTPGLDDDSPAATAPFVSPKLFRANTITRELQDIADVMDWIMDAGSAELGIAEDARVGLWGHSRGGVAAVLYALVDPNINALVTWSASAHPDRWTDRQKEVWREKGELAFTDYASGTRLALGIGLLDDIEQNRDFFAAGDRAVDLTIPHLIVHGEHDPTVAVEQSYLYYDTPTIHADKKLLRLLTGHTFSYEEGKESEALINAGKATVEWFETYLRATSAPGS